MRGRDVYAGMCAGCHPAVTHVGPVFTKSWAGKKLSDLFGFLRERMPKNDPGSLSEQEYVDVMSYMLRLNGMPAGVEEMPADSVALTKVRIDSSRVSPPDDADAECRFEQNGAICNLHLQSASAFCSLTREE